MSYPRELLDTYEVYEEIGSGGGGIVYKGFHKRLKKEVVIKKLKNVSVSIDECRTEVDILKELRHSYLPQVQDFIVAPEGMYTVMDFIPGKSLQNMLDEKHKFKEKEVLKYTRQLCEALDYLHSQNPPIIHGDIKPDNIMITPDGNVCLIDFNISGVLEGKGATTTGYTPGYGAPEQKEAFEKLMKERQKEAQKQSKKNSKIASNATNAQPQSVQQGNNDKTVMLSAIGEVAPTVMLTQSAIPTVMLSEAENAPAVSVQQEVELQASVSEPKRGIKIDERSDIYALGATIYTLLTGKIREPKDKKLVLPNTSSGLAVVLNKALAYSPGKRYADAGKMLQAVISVHKKDKRYKKLLRRQETTFIILFFMMAASVLCIVKGMKTIGEEREDRYEELVVAMQEATESRVNEDEFNELYNEAVSLYTSNQAAYYEKAYYLYTCKDAEATVEYISEIIYHFAYGTSVMKSNLYHLYAESYFELEEYDKAARYYKEAANSWQGSAQIYRDYAISLIYLEQFDEAEEILKTATEAGMEQADIYMVQGELYRMEGESEKAIEALEGAISEATDAYAKERAYVIASEVFNEIGTEEALLRDVEWLNKAVKELDAANRILIYEHLVQDYITLGEITKNNEYYVHATDVLEEIVTMGWSNYLTYSNLIVIYQRMGDIDSAAEWANEMLGKYPEHYVTYLRLSYLEIEKQNQKENKERSYDDFATYYSKTKECYEKQASGNVTNAEIQLLDQTYKQLVDLGWLE